jgi:hypothetical protein
MQYIVLYLWKINKSKSNEFLISDGLMNKNRFEVNFY